eukprot:2020743-Rhodomonas_salina.3
MIMLLLTTNHSVRFAGRPYWRCPELAQDEGDQWTTPSLSEMSLSALWHRMILSSVKLRDRRLWTCMTTLRLLAYATTAWVWGGEFASAVARLCSWKCGCPC